MAVGGGVLNWVFDTVVPEISNLGEIGSVNLTESAEYTITPINTLVQSFSWLAGVLYVLMLIGVIAMAFIIKSSPSKWLIGFFMLCIILLVLGSIFISNMYQDFYSGTDDMASRLKEQTLLSFMILNAPLIFTIVAFVTGIVLFTGMGQEEVYV
jgi:hypothetical protein